MPFLTVGLGELLWDQMPGGRQMGGAPANFAYHTASLGAQAVVVSRVGTDPDGEELIHRLASLGLGTEAIERDPSAPTGTVSVELGGDGQPRFTIHENVAWDHLEGQWAGLQAVAKAEAICFGTLAQRSEPSRHAIRRLLDAARPEALRIFDINLRQHYHSREVIVDSLSRAEVLKINETELPQLAGMLKLAGDVRDQIRQLAELYDLRTVAYTRGAHGSLLFDCGRWSDHPGVPTRVADTVGAGDSFTAALVMGLLGGHELDAVHDWANRVASFVASQPGATPRLPEELRAGPGRAGRQG